MIVGQQTGRTATGSNGGEGCRQTLRRRELWGKVHTHMALLSADCAAAVKSRVKPRRREVSASRRVGRRPRCRDATLAAASDADAVHATNECRASRRVPRLGFVTPWRKPVRLAPHVAARGMPHAKATPS